MTDKPTIEKYEFACPEWCHVAREYVEKALADVDLTGVDIEFCEEFTDAPAHLSPDGSPIGWHMVIKDGQIDVGPGLIETDAKIIADYNTILPLARAVIDPTDAAQLAELGAVMAKAAEEGKFTAPPSGGSSPQSLEQLGGLHNALAERTL